MLVAANLHDFILFTQSRAPFLWDFVVMYLE